MKWDMSILFFGKKINIVYDSVILLKKYQYISYKYIVKSAFVASLISIAKQKKYKISYYYNK
jgi:hypothetical protein